MIKTVIDIETTYTLLNKKKNPSPFLETNDLVSVGILSFNENGEIVNNEYWVIKHKELTNLENLKDKANQLQAILDKTDIIIGHNLKFDMSWLYEMGFIYDKPMYDTMITEYAFAKGLKRPLSLKECCIRYGLSEKLDVLEQYFKAGLNTDEIPLKELIEYGKQDIVSTKELYEKQQELFQKNEDCKYMQKSVSLMDELLPVLIDMERNGIYINLEELDKVEQEYRKESNALTTKLEAIVVDVMGHTPINLDSSEHLSWVLYSRKVLDKPKWKEVFNLGSEIRNSVVKAKYVKRHDKATFAKIVKEYTEKLYKTEASQCEICIGKGRIQKFKKDGTLFKKETKCTSCNATGFIYTNTKQYAGFKITPLGSEYASQGGFSTDKATIAALLVEEKVSPLAKEFLSGLLRLNAIQTYLNTFVEGIKKNVHNNIIHPSFNQCITATGRLSSSNPNFQNLPRAKTFPIRKVIKSRFEGGKIFSVDFKQLEFRVAAILGKDKQAEFDILNKVDIHAFTRDTITKYGQTIDRQTAKSHTFKPLFSGTSGTDAEKKYYKEFNDKYHEIAAWQNGLLDEVLRSGQIKSPSGRIYAFPTSKRLTSGYVVGQTQIYNYMIQGFATGDICPVALIEIYKRMKSSNLKSKLILTVHDDLTFDVHPDEIEIMITLVKKVFSNMNVFVEGWFGITTNIPIEGDFSIGDNWLDKVELAA